MKIKTAEFIKGLTGPDKILFDGIPQVAFIGRSNVGKSSTINCLTNKKGLARTSARTGKTREINFFFINNKIYFVDLPGYGFAKMSREDSDKVNANIEWYVRGLEVRPKYTVVIIDSKVGITDSDKLAIDILDESGHNVIIVANKTDKLKKSDIHKKNEEFRIESGGKLIIMFSAKDRTGRGELLKLFFSV